MNEYNWIDEQEIDLIEFIIDMFEQWRGWLFAGIICALLVPGLKYLKDTSSSSIPITLSEAESATTEASIESAVMATNSGVALNYYVIWQQFKDSYESSIVMDLDASDIRRLNLQYYLECAEGGSDYIAGYYSNLSSDGDFIVAVLKALDIDDSSVGNVTDLITVFAEGSSVNQGGNLDIMIILPVGADEEKLIKAIDDYISSESAKISAVIGNHNVVRLSSTVYSAYDEEILSMQGNAVSNINNWKNSFLNVYKNLSGEEQKTVDEVITKVNSGELTYQDVRSMYPAETEVKLLVGDEKPELSGNEAIVGTTSSPKVSFSKKYALVGFVLGVLLYYGGAFAALIFSRRYRSGEEASKALALRSYGDIYVYPYHGLKAFLHDKKIYAWRHKKTSNTENVAQSICAKAKFESISKLTCIVLGDGGKICAENLDEIVKKSSASGVEINLKNAPKGLASLSEDEIGKFSPVLLTVVSGQVQPAQAMELLFRLKEYNISLFGMNFIEA